MRLTLSSLALLVAATTVAAGNVVTLAMPDDTDDGATSVFPDIDFNIVGINGSTTSFVPNCPASSTTTITASASTATDDNSVECDMTLVSGPKTLWFEYEGEEFYHCDMGEKSATCYLTWTTTSGTSTIGTSVSSDKYPITSAAVTIASTAASVTPTASASAKASVSGIANATSTSASASANASQTDNAAVGLPTGHAFLAAGGAAMALALAIA